jgi:hypothetical protein
VIRRTMISWVRLMPRVAAEGSAMNVGLFSWTGGR